MASFHHVMSHRHFTSLFKKSEHITSLQNIVFLIKDKINDTFRYTQSYLPHCRPIKAFLHGYDITSFLVHRNNLTNYSYFFINYAYSLDFTILDVRSYFKGFQAVTSKQPDQKRLLTKGIRGPYKRTERSTQQMNSQQMAEQSRIPFDATSPGVKLYGKMLEKTPVEINFTRTQTNVFKDSRIFRAALRLACSRVTRFKMPETSLELKQILSEAGLKINALQVFYHYLFDLDPSLVTIAGLQKTLDELSATCGWFPSGSKRFGEDSLRQSLVLNDYKVLGITPNQLVEVMFPTDWNTSVTRVTPT